MHPVSWSSVGLSLVAVAALGMLRAQAQEAAPAKFAPTVIAVLDQHRLEQSYPKHQERVRQVRELSLKSIAESKLRTTELAELRAKLKTLDPKGAEAEELKATISKKHAEDQAILQDPKRDNPRINLLDDTHQEVRDAVRSVCQRQGIDLVVPRHDGRQPLIYFADKLDITGLVLAELTKKPATPEKE